jgi:hypothetical protein
VGVAMTVGLYRPLGPAPGLSVQEIGVTYFPGSGPADNHAQSTYHLELVREHVEYDITLQTHYPLNFKWLPSGGCEVVARAHT